MKNLPQNKWIRAAIPALLIHCSIGTVYCWSLVKGDIAQQIGAEKSQVEWAFSLAIFFLGMSAAFAGKIVEKDIHKSSLIAAIFFCVGMAGTGLSIHFHSLIGIFICYGIIMGIGLGIGYLTPVKTLMLWFKEQKGLATGLAVAGFGLAKVIASPIMEALMASVGIEMMFYILAAVYFIMMFAGHLMLHKPEGWVEQQSADEKVKVIEIFKNPTFIGIWLMFFINITCGLALIAQEKDMLKVGFGETAAIIGIISSLTAVFNAGGRLGLSAAADKLKDRNTIYKIIFIACIAMTLLAIITGAGDVGIMPIVIILLFIVNAGYGGGFSNLPTLLSDHFGMKNISQIHGLALSAWAFAGLCGNQISSFITTKYQDNNPFTHVLYVTVVMYIIALLVSFVLVHSPKAKK